MTGVISFRPTDGDVDLIERTKARMGFDTNAEAVRYLLREGAAGKEGMADDPLFTHRAPKEHWLKDDLTSRDIDEALYGDDEA